MDYLQSAQVLGFALKGVGLAVIAWGIFQGCIFMIFFGEVIDLLQKNHYQNDPKAQAV